MKLKIQCTSCTRLLLIPIPEETKDVMEVIGGKTDFFLRSKSGYFEYKKMFVPFFEIACNPVMPFDDDLKGKPSQEILDFLTAFAKKGLLEEETKLFKKLRRYLKTGKGVFSLRTDVCVLQAVDPENNRSINKIIPNTISQGI